MFKIGDFSKLSKITIRMLRYYDEQGLLVPQQIDASSGYRYYNANQLATAHRILSLKEMGFSVSVISDILKNCNTTESFKNYLVIRHTEMQNELHEGQNRLNLLKTTIERLQKENQIMKYDVILKETPAMKVLCLRDIIPEYSAEGQLWGRFMENIASQKINYTNPPLYMGIFHDSGYKEKDVDIEICVTVAKERSDIGDVKFRVIQPQSVASAVVKGGFSLLTEANQQIANWIEDNGYTINGNMYNIYHVSPACDPNPDNWVTELVYPIAKV